MRSLEVNCNRALITFMMGAGLGTSLIRAGLRTSWAISAAAGVSAGFAAALATSVRQHRLSAEEAECIKDLSVKTRFDSVDILFGHTLLDVRAAIIESVRRCAGKPVTMRDGVVLDRSDKAANTAYLAECRRVLRGAEELAKIESSPDLPLPPASERFKFWQDFALLFLYEGQRLTLDDRSLSLKTIELVENAEGYLTSPDVQVLTVNGQPLTMGDIDRFFPGAESSPFIT